MPIIEIDKSVLEEIGNAIEQRDEMYENQIATTKKLTDGIEKLYEQEVKKLRNQLQQKENIRKEVREYVEKCSILGVNEVDSYCMGYDVRDDLLKILDKEVN